MPTHLNLPPCQWLPLQPSPLAAASILELKADRGPEFYIRCLHIAQSQWLQGIPAQAILFVNRALGADVDPDHAALQAQPLPYPAVVWLLKNAKDDHFVGNPRRHWQHLATRMVEPRKELRTWRAWACWMFARLIFPDLPADEKQIGQENIVEPTKQEILAKLASVGHPGEAAQWLALVDELEMEAGTLAFSARA